MAQKPSTGRKKYLCTATTKSNLTQHEPAEHEGKRYPCDSYDSQAITTQNLGPS